MTITLPPDVAKRIERAIAFRNWSDGTNHRVSVEKYVLTQMDSVLKSVEEDMVQDSHGNFIADRLWEWDHFHDR